MASSWCGEVGGSGRGWAMKLIDELLERQRVMELLVGTPEGRIAGKLRALLLDCGKRWMRVV